MGDYQIFLREAAYIGGEWIEADTEAKTAVYDPANAELIGHVPALDEGRMDRAIEAAVSAFDGWRRTAPLTRADRLDAWYRGMQDNREALARLMSREQGKPIGEARGEVDYAASFLRWFGEEARRFRGRTIPPEDPTMALGTVEEPVGVAAVITPWNFPLAMITRKIAAALAAGCTTLVNPATETPFCAIALAILAEKAGLTNGEFNVVTGPGKQFGERVCADERVRALSFTGSTAVGRKLLEQSAATVKKNAMELGGNAPLIVCEDADFEAALDSAIAAKFQTSGQDCLAANRLYVHRSLYDEFVDRFVEKMNAMPVGHGLDEATEIGPLIHADAVEKARSLVEDAREKGARILGRDQSEAPGENFFMPVAVADFTPDMRVASEEQFAPIAAITAFDDDDGVIAAANDTIAGLASYVYTPSEARSRRYLRGLDYGMVGINTMDLTAPHVPFGGVKQSGLGREGGHVGMAEYLETKYYCVGNLPEV
jgi:succinate-semialdehyde dehydrogenase/glutarate-semialdehyde dehydrogenase/aspartate-semialdehyde dehydrogenase